MSSFSRRSTVILVASSFTCQWGVFAAEKGDVYKLRRWFAITFIMGLIFVLGQGNEYRHLVSEGIKINQDGYGSMFYLTTGFQDAPALSLLYKIGYWNLAIGFGAMVGALALLSKWR